MATKKATKQPTAGGDVIQATIGDNAQQVAVGKHIQQQHGSGKLEVTEADLEQVRQLFAQLIQQIEQEAPPDKKEAAVERVKELEEEITSQKPSLSTFEYVKNWFGKNAPGMLGAVTSVVVNPIVGKVVEAASGIAADKFLGLFA